MTGGHGPWVLLIADRQSVSREVARSLVDAGLHVQTVSSIREAISVVMLEGPTVVVFDSHLAVSEGAHTVAVLLRTLQSYGTPAVDFVVYGAADDDGLRGAGRPAPLRPRSPLPFLRAEAEPPNESVG